MGVTTPEVHFLTELGGRYILFYDPGSEVTQCHFHHILFVRSKSLRSAAHIQEKAIWSQFVERRVKEGRVKIVFEFRFS